MLEGLMDSDMNAFGMGWARRETFPVCENALPSNKVEGNKHAKISRNSCCGSQPHRVRLLRRGESISDR